MDRTHLRVLLVKQDKKLIDVHRATGISYGRLVRMVNGYTNPRGSEVESIARFLGIERRDLEGTAT